MGNNSYYQTAARFAFHAVPILYCFMEIQKRREAVCKNLELKPDETSYSDIMHRLVKRYLFKLERAKDEKEIGEIT